MGPREFMRRWLQGMKDLSQAQLLRAQMVNQFGSAVGLVFVIVTVWIFGAWYWIAFLGFIVGLQVISGLKSRRELNLAVLLEKSAEKAMKGK